MNVPPWKSKNSVLEIYPNERGRFLLTKKKNLNSGHSTKLHNTVLNKRRFIISLILLTYIVMLLAGALTVAVRRPLWIDELYSYYIATLPRFSDVWSLLLSGYEQNSPAFYAIERLSLGMFGVNNVALRLPALLGCLVMSLALFSFVSHRLTPAYGLLAALFPMITKAYYYSHEARAYGLELGFAALALVCWQRATESNDRLFALLGLWLSLVAAISCHYYGVLVVLPLAFGELLRTIARKRIDFEIWICFAGSALPLMLTLPLILSAAKFSGEFWAQPHWQDISFFYKDIMGETALPVVAVVTLGVIASAFLKRVPAIDSHAANGVIPNHELGAIIGFIALPFAGMLLAKLITHAFTYRYVLAAVVGLGVLFSQAMYILLRGEFRAAAMSALVLVAWFGAKEVHEVDLAAHLRYRLEESIALLRSANRENLPIVVADTHTFVELSHYAPPEITSNLVYLTDSALASQILGVGNDERSMLEVVGPWFHMHVVPFEQFAKTKTPFLIYGNLPSKGSWVVPTLKERRFRVEFQSSMPAFSTEADKYLFFAVTSDQ